MNGRAPAAQREAAARGEARRFRNLSEAEDLDVERARAVLGADRGRTLGVIEFRERRLVDTVRRATAAIGTRVTSLRPLF